jgi:hypothetical protein
MGGKLPALGLSPGNIEDIYPCSPLQNGILVSQMKAPDLYHTRTVWKTFPGKEAVSVNLQQLQLAWQRVVDRHPCLRTSFVGDTVGDSTF